MFEVPTSYVRMEIVIKEKIQKTGKEMEPFQHIYLAIRPGHECSFERHSKAVFRAGSRPTRIQNYLL